MDLQERVKHLFSYMLDVKKIKEKNLRSVYEYEQVYWYADLENAGCSITRKNEGIYIEVSKEDKGIYAELFSQYMNLLKSSEEIEVIFGNGVLALAYGEQKILHPMFTMKMELNFDTETERFIFKSYGKSMLEIAMLEGLDLPNLLKIAEDSKVIEEKVADLLDIDVMENVLKGYGELLFPEPLKEVIVFKEIYAGKQIKLSDTIRFYNAPVILLRKRDVRLWPMEINQILTKIEEGYSIPKTVQALIEEDHEQDEETKREWEGIGEQLLFPLPANEEQKEIVKRLQESNGVVVQGPPGTGKSHTIVNLICHLLAQGKTVLVTSQTDKALRVLGDKIPEEIRVLCMSILGDDTKANQELDEAIRKIMDNLSVNPDVLKREAVQAQADLEACRQRQAMFCKRIKEEYEREKTRITYKGKYYTLSEIAQWVQNHEAEYGWITDEIEPEKANPITEQEFQQLLALLKLIHSEDMERLNKNHLFLDKLPSYQEISEKMVNFLELRDMLPQLQDALIGWSVPEITHCNYDAVLRLLQGALHDLKDLQGTWMYGVLDKFHKSTLVGVAVKKVYEGAQQLLQEIRKIIQQLSGHSIILPEQVEISRFEEDLKMLSKVLGQNKKLNKWFLLLHKECQYVLHETTVDGSPIEQGEQLEYVRLYVKERLLLKQLLELWNQGVGELGGPRYSEIDTAALTDIEEVLQKLKAIIHWDELYKDKVIALLKKIALPMSVHWYRKEDYEYLVQCVTSIQQIEAYRDVKAYFKEQKNMLFTIGGLEALQSALENCSLIEIKEAYLDLERLKRVRPFLKQAYTTLNKFQPVCPQFVEHLMNAEDKETIYSKYKSYNLAWRWKQWNALLRRLHQRDAEFLERKLEDERKAERELVKEVIAKRTWQAVISKINETQKRSMVAWFQAVKRIGKGTGTLAAEYRRAAQNEMEKCKEVIPVWIMPLNRLIENLKLSDKYFDVVIFDESSQSDIFAACALMRAKKAIIVGDDKQISPETIGINQNAVNYLIQKHLKDIPHAAWFDLNTSLYDTALRVFPSRLMLKEHFRCVPEIIAFSNDFIYSGEIIPVRQPQPFERFDQPVVPVRVRDAVRDTTKPVNRREAETVAEKITECCRDERYKGMTMGVISLLGEAQGDYILNLLRERIGEAEIIRRRIICGDAYSFQGDERDVMFLSMVIAENVKYTALTKEADIRRFNVAASRARNQMWLFYSIDPEDLNPDCARYALLKFCLQTEKKLIRSEKTIQTLTSEVERQVYNYLTTRGYYVVPKVSVGRFKADFIVEGAGSRVAVLCDGEEKQGAVFWEEEFSRKMDLKSAGWSFYRIRESEFYIDPEKTMEKLCSLLEQEHIERYTG